MPERIELPESTREAIRRLVESAPAPTAEQAARLRRMLRPGFERAARERDEAA